MKIYEPNKKGQLFYFHSAIFDKFFVASDKPPPHDI